MLESVEQTWSEIATNVPRPGDRDATSETDWYIGDTDAEREPDWLTDPLTD
jgi:hypothetical protein